MPPFPDKTISFRKMDLLIDLRVVEKKPTVAKRILLYNSIQKKYHHKVSNQPMRPATYLPRRL
ncbi:MAG: hypothetical protein ACKOC0_13910 [Cytophagales bacterium]